MNTPARSRRRARSPARRNLEGARSIHFRRLEAITRARNVPLMLAALTAASALLAAPAAHAAFLPLPATGAQVNDDPVNSIDPSEIAGVADVPAGSLPALNIHVLRTAENPSVAGGAAVAGKDPVPWVTWEENDGVPDDGTTRRQIFVSKGVKQAVAGTACPVGTKPVGGNDVNGFCFQQVGLERLDPNGPTALATGDPTLNIDPTRSGVEPDIAFTGPNDTVAWVVWYEEDPTAIAGLRNTDMVFAARIVADGTADGGFRWVAVGNGTAGQTNVLDTSGAHGFGNCVETEAAEDACALNAVARRDAENPRVAAGTLKPGGATVPWVVWQEDLGDSKHAVFVSRLVGGDHFELFNSGQPVSDTAHD